MVGKSKLCSGCVGHGLPVNIVWRLCWNGVTCILNGVHEDGTDGMEQGLDIKQLVHYFFHFDASPHFASNSEILSAMTLPSLLKGKQTDGARTRR